MSASPAASATATGAAAVDAEIAGGDRVLRAIAGERDRSLSNISYVADLSPDGTQLVLGELGRLEAGVGLDLQRQPLERRLLDLLCQALHRPRAPVPGRETPDGGDGVRRTDGKRSPAGERSERACDGEPSHPSHPSTPPC